MLIYHPAYDAYGCMFRILAITDVVDSVEVDALRLLDFVLCFPSVFSDFRLPASDQNLRKVVKDLENPYRSVLNKRGAYFGLKEIQEGAIHCLAAAGFLARDELERGRVVRTSASLPFELAKRVDDFRKAESIFFTKLLEPMLRMPLNGDGGLKDRSGLMEYRYDYVKADPATS